MLALVLAATFLTPGLHAVGYRAEAIVDPTRGRRTVYAQAWYRVRARKDCARAVFTRVASLNATESVRARARRELKALAGNSTTCKYLEGLETP